MNINDEDFWAILIGISLVVLLVMVILCVAQNNSRLMDQCIADGNKEYECHAMIVGGR